MGNSVQKIVGLTKRITNSTTGANMAKRIGRTYRNADGYMETFEGSKQVINGLTVVKGRTRPIIGYDKTLTKISKQIPNGSKEVSRIIPDGRSQLNGDITKITTEEMSRVGKHRINTFNQKVYEYDNLGLNIAERTIDRVFAGRHLLGGRALFSNMNSLDTSPSLISKNFFGADGKLLKTVHYNPKTGLRDFALLPDGRILSFDAKGLPTFTDVRSCNVMDLGGLDKLI